MKVKNMTSSKGNPVANQFIITDLRQGLEYFQSYKTIIVQRGMQFDSQTYLDINKWDYSVTTGRYRNHFLGETKAETQKKIDSGEYKLVDLN